MLHALNFTKQKRHVKINMRWKKNELKETPHIKPNGVEIAETIARSRTMVLYYGKEVFPQIQKENSKIYEIYLCLCEGINLEDFKKANLVNLKHKFSILESQLETIKELNKTSVIDLRAYINTL